MSYSLRPDALEPALASPGKAFAHWAMGVAALLVLIWIVHDQVGWAALVDLWVRVSIGVWLGCLTLFIASHLVRALRIQRYVTREMIGLGAVIKLSVTHLFFNNLLPMRLGEAAFPILLKRYTGITLGQGLSQLIWLRLLDVLIMGTAAMVVLMLLAHWISPQTAALLGGAAMLGVIAGVGYLPLQNLYAKGAGRLPGVVGRTAASFFHHAPQQARLRVELVVLSIFGWLAKLAAIMMLIGHLVATPWSALAAGALAGEASGVLPIHGLAGAGTYEAAFVAGAAITGADTTALLAAAVSAHIFIFAATAVLALVVMPIRVQRSTV